MYLIGRRENKQKSKNQTENKKKITLDSFIIKYTIKKKSDLKSQSEIWIRNL